MDIQKISTDQSLFNVSKELHFNEIKDLMDTHHVSKFNLFKFTVKRLLIDLFNFFSNKKKEYNSNRAIENVKSKYDKISGSYIEYYYGEEGDKTNDFVAYNHFEKKIYLVNGNCMSTPANIISKLCNYYNLKSILEVGAGELTTLLPVVKKSKNINFISGLDLSLNRLKKGKELFNKNNQEINQLIVCDASKLPYQDYSFDICYTHYCIEQVPMLAKKIIDEMIRVSSKYIVIIEPSYEYSNKITKNRILEKGFPILKKKHFKNINANILYRDGLPFTRYALYGEITVLEKVKKLDGIPSLCHPISKHKMEIAENFLKYKNNEINIKDGIINLSNLNN
tara:strand:- start:74 stop:1087 length:1014 start_codon:yes stop_codon:yes gene_type:complete